MERAFAMLAELLQQEQFELLISEEDQTDHSVETDIRLVYLMNDAVESFLVFKEAKMTGKYLRDYEGMLDATLSKEEETYILTVWQDDQALTIFFKQLELEVYLYDEQNPLSLTGHDKYLIEALYPIGTFDSPLGAVILLHYGKASQSQLACVKLLASMLTELTQSN